MLYGIAHKNGGTIVGWKQENGKDQTWDSFNDAMRAWDSYEVRSYVREYPSGNDARKQR